MYFHSPKRCRQTPISLRTARAPFHNLRNGHLVEGFHAGRRRTLVRIYRAVDLSPAPALRCLSNWQPILSDGGRRLCSRVTVPLMGLVRCIRRDRCGAAIPSIAASVVALPACAPMLAPTWRCVYTPLTEVLWRFAVIAHWILAEVSWRFAVIAHWNPQHIERYRVGIHQLPWPVVPRARVPVLSLVDPILAIVEERVLHSPA